MPPRSQRYALVGFSDALDWKPLDFVRPLPPCIVCAVCSVVRAAITPLPCGHSLCDGCSEQCAVDGGQQCPLDGDRYALDDVGWARFGADYVLEREVYCWNKQSGCEAVLAVSEVYTHFRTECRHHSTFCPRCSETVLCNTVCTHIRSHCSTPVVTSPSVRSRELSSTGEMIARATKEVLENPVAEIKAALHAILSENNTQSNALNDLCLKMDDVIDVIMQESRMSQIRERFASASERSGTDHSVAQGFMTWNSSLAEISENLRGLRDTMAKVELATNPQWDTLAKATAEVGAIKMEIVEGNRKILHGTEKVIAHHSVLLGFYDFVVQGIESLKLAATIEGKSHFHCSKIYLRGYCMSPGVTLQKQEQSFSLHILISLHKGAIDDFVEWPFQKVIKLSVMHPISGLQRDIRCDLAQNGSLCLHKPVESSSEEGLSVSPSLCLNGLERDGYVRNDQLQCRWTLL
ncbi:TNF receptor-associated factor 6-like [Dermacentor variabilis]|uniref:TNF receptor-associated factor 6-like n=1 Tax=Dermacentor variabilis TaxID=34621 RepID=UPI003F5B194F